MKKYAINLDRKDLLYYFTAVLCVFVYAGSLFFPLIDKDAAHHANIALNMYEHNNYVNLIDRGKDYLDKPHFLFWASALSYKIFGVNSFAYRFPALVFALLSIYSTYKLTKHLSDRTTARLAAIMLGTAQAFVLSIIDARMETPLTGGIIFGLWQMIIYLDKRKFINLFFAALGTAIAFSTKGWLGPVIIFVSTFFYVILNQKWKVFSFWKTWLFVPLFILFISPVLYAYYLQYDLHPEKMIRGQTNISGVKFILWDQLFERYKGFDVGGRNSSYFFLYHTFLWAFFPWCIVAYVAIFFWLKRMFYNKKWNSPFNFAALSFAFILFVISFSKFKMPHYIIMLLPLAAIFTAPYSRFILSYKKAVRFYYPLQFSFAILILLATIALNYYFFPPRNIFVLIIGSLLIISFILLLMKRVSNKAMKVLYISATLSLVFNFFMSYNFFPSLMKYQGGNELVKEMKRRNISIPDENIILFEPHAHSFDFYSKHNHRFIEPREFSPFYPELKDKYFLLSTNVKHYLDSSGYRVEPVISHIDYNIARIKLSFLNPSTRSQMYDTLMLVKIYKP